MNSENVSVLKEVAFGFLPVKKEERVFGFWDLLFIQVGIGISIFIFLVGGYTGMALQARDAIAVILFGNAFAFLLILPIILLFARYGIDTFIGFRSTLGFLGNNILFVMFMVLTTGFISVGCVVAGESAVELVKIMGAGEFFTSSTTGVPFFAILSFLIAFFVAYKGPVAIKWFNWIGVPAILLVLCGLILAILFGEGLNKVFSITPLEPYETRARSIATMLEINVGLGFSWLLFLGQYARLAKSEKIAFTSGFWSYGVLVNVAAILGALAALVAGSLAPTEWMLQIGGAFWGIVGLILLTLGNITAAVFLIYSQAISFKTIFPKQKWWLAVGSTLPAVYLILNPSIYAAYDSFISFISYILGVMGGILVFDFLFVKKQRISIRDLYNPYGVYRYWYGINPSAFISLFVGTIVYWTLYNPITDNASSLFLYITAGIPSYLVSGICYFVLAKYVFSFFEVD